MEVGEAIGMDEDGHIDRGFARITEERRVGRTCSKLLYSLFVCFSLLLNHVVGDAEGVAKIKRGVVFAEDSAPVSDKKAFSGFDVLYGETGNRRPGVEVAVDIELEVAGVVLKGEVRFTDQAKLHHVGVEVFGSGDVYEMNGDAVV